MRGGIVLGFFYLGRFRGEALFGEESRGAFHDGSEQKGSSMRQTRIRICTMALVIVCAAFAADAADQADKVELLSTHETVAEFTGIEYRVCRGLTSRCPENCGGSGEFAVFSIVEYLNYEKPGKYGDAKAKDRRIRMSDFHKKPIGDPKLNEKITGLKKSDRVLLSWNHNYVTRTFENGTTGSFPERPITKLEKMEAE